MHTLPTVINGGGGILSKFSKNLVWGVVINRGVGKIRRKSRNSTKNCTNLKELEEFFGRSEKLFPEIVVGGGVVIN